MKVVEAAYRLVDTLRQALAEVQDKCAHLEIDLSNAVPRANEAEAERDALRRKLDAAMPIVEAARAFSDSTDANEMRAERVLLDAVREYTALESDPT